MGDLHPSVQGGTKDSRVVVLEGRSPLIGGPATASGKTLSILKRANQAVEEHGASGGKREGKLGGGVDRVVQEQIEGLVSGRKKFGNSEKRKKIKKNNPSIEGKWGSSLKVFGRGGKRGGGKECCVFLRYVRAHRCWYF